MAEAFVGEIRMIGFNYVPDGWLFCDGQSLNISTNAALYSLLGTNYGGDGKTTFNLPDLNGKKLTAPIIPIGSNNTLLGQTGIITIPASITSSTLPAQSISFTLLNTKVI